MKPWVSIAAIGHQNRPTVRRENLFQSLKEALFHTWVSEPIFGVHLEIQRQRTTISRQRCNQGTVGIADAGPIHQNNGPTFRLYQQRCDACAYGRYLAQQVAIAQESIDAFDVMLGHHRASCRSAQRR